MEFHFDVDIAVKYGVEEAIMINNLKFWILKNMANNKHYHDGYYWTYNSVRAFSELFPFWSNKQITRILKSLEDKKVLKTGNYNTIPYDKTKWYALEPSILNISPNGQKGSTKWGNRIDQKGKAIPYNKPYNKTYISNDEKIYGF